MVTSYKKKTAHAYSLGTAQAQGNAYCKRPITLPSLESKRRFDIETFKHECPQCRKQEKYCNLCGGTIEEVDDTT